MNLGNDKWQNTQGKLGSSSTGRGEAPETRGRELESLLATTEYESPTDTVVVRAVLGSQLSRTAVYGPVRTVVWQGSAGDRRPYADSREVAPKSHFDANRCSQRNICICNNRRRGGQLTYQNGQSPVPLPEGPEGEGLGSG